MLGSVNVLYLVAEVYRGRMQIKTARSFTDLAKAYEYYQKLSPHLRRIWELCPDTKRPMKVLTSKLLREKLQQAKIIP